ncbi:hypothetical protein ES695_18885 [Candidatus Atribacteria bacterium 1244-E10-H5-B2]|nr:MAG: hypothetical protein ES695_18885 [Candidatus Atribacteria bacterium 1244-E10-H5-B2]
MKKGSFVEFFDDSEIARRYEDRKEEIEKGGLLKMFDEASFLKDKPVWEGDLFKKISNFCLNEIKKGVVVTFLETYTRYSYNNLMFCKMKSTSESLKIYLKLRYSELEEPPKWVRDYSKISHQTWVEIVIREGDLFDNETILFDMVFNLIKKSFNRVIRSPRLGKVSVGKPVKTLPEFVTPTKLKLDLEISTDGFVQLGLRVHKSQLPKILEKLLE